MVTSAVLLPEKMTLDSSNNNLYSKKDRFTNIALFSAPYLREVCLRKSIVATEHEFDALFQELKRYLFLCSITKEPVAMLNDKIDEVWHQFILFTRMYEDFCKNCLGNFIHHSPNTSFTPTTKGSAFTFVTKYNKYFGKVPNIWMLPEKFLTYNDGVRLVGDNCGGTDCGGNCDD